MKTTMKLMLMLLVAAGMLTFSSCKKDEPKQLPEKITVSGQVTDKDGQPFENVSVYIDESSFMVYAIPVANTYTDENGVYQIEFSPREGQSYSIEFQILKDDYQYYHHHSLDPWEAEQEYYVVLKKSEE